jgi:hypothetical protein
MWLRTTAHHRDDRPETLERWDPSWIKLAGIEHRTLRWNWITGTLIRRVLDFLTDDYPGLGPSIRLTMP